MTVAELMIVVVVMGLVVGISAPYLQGLSDTHQVRGTAENIAGQMRIARATAISSGTLQRFCLYGIDGGGYAFHVHDGTGPVKSTWILPKNVAYAWGTTLKSVDFASNGRVSAPLEVDLLGRRAERDTISVEKSGYIIVH